MRDYGVARTEFGLGDSMDLTPIALSGNRVVGFNERIQEDRNAQPDRLGSECPGHSAKLEKQEGEPHHWRVCPLLLYYVNRFTKKRGLE